MKSLDFSLYALSISVAAAMLAGCGGSQPLIGEPGAMAQSEVQPSISVQRDADGSWMVPDATRQDLLYIANSTTVTVYSYPGGQHLRTLYHFYDPQGECVDKN